MTHQRQVRQLAKRIIPKSPLVNTWAAWCRLKSQSARHIFEAAGDSPAWLEIDELDVMQRAYPLEPLYYGYDPDSIVARGRERARAMLDLTRHSDQFHRFLDLGMWDGMTCFALQELGKSTTGIDIRVEGLDRRAIDSGACLLYTSPSPRD